MKQLYKENFKDLTLFELKSFLFRMAKKDRPTLFSGENYLNLGCGPNVVQGVVNADFFGSVRFWRNKRNLEWHLDLRYPLNCNDSVFDGIFSEHVLEHLYIDEAKALLAELFRILKHGSCIRISVPDLEKYIAFYSKTLKKEEMDFFNQKFPRRAVAIRNVAQNYLHHSLWDFEELAHQLANAGFEKIERKSYAECADSKLCLDMQAREWESLYVEARKPAN